MLISLAHAASEAAATATPDSSAEFFGLNMVMIIVFIGLFYLIMIVPQQRRYKAHAKMLNELKKGDSVVTAGGLIGKVHTPAKEGGDELVVDLGNDIKVTVLKSSIQQSAELAPKKEDAKKAKVAPKASKDKKDSKKDDKAK